MLVHPTLERLHVLGLLAMADAFVELQNTRDAAELSREDWLGLRHRQDPCGARTRPAACQKGLSVGVITAAALVHELLEARNEKRLLRLQKQLDAHKLLIIDELGFVPLSTTGAELLFEIISRRYERGSVMVTSNLPFDNGRASSAPSD